jgi:hypothetical protein
VDADAELVPSLAVSVEVVAACAPAVEVIW